MMDDTSSTMTRRAAMLGAGATAVLASSCSAPEVPTTMSEPLHAAREAGLVFTDAAGNVIDVNALQRRLNGNPSTVSFLFGQCGDICPLTGIALGHVSQRYPNLHNVVISVQPQFDKSSLESFLSAGFMRRWDDTSPVEYTGLRTQDEAFGRRANTTVLYPALLDVVGDREVVTHADITMDPAKTEELNRRIGLLQQRYFNLPTAVDPIVGHTGTVLVYDNNGNLAHTIDETENIVTELPQALDAITRGQQANGR